MRSLLFVPGDRPDRFEKAIQSGADALILDLEDSVMPERKDAARKAIVAFLGQPRKLPLFVRINPLDTELAAADLTAVLPFSPDGLVLPKAEGAVTVRALAAISALPILPIATETASAVFELGSYKDVARHLFGLTWGAEDLPAAIGATTSRKSDGRYTAPYEMIRALTLFAAHSAGVAVIETVFPDFRDLTGLKSYAERGYRDGFTGMMAIHPAQVAIINAAFQPNAAQIAHASAVVSAFDANPDAGALQLDGKMIDAPHVKAARNLLSRAQ
jgi:citrate lyase subunit beta/citryl-CoA lyase